MPNLIDNIPINNILRDKATRVRTQKAQDWFSRHAKNWLRNREDCAQLITLGEPNLPNWAIRRLQAGELIHRFFLSEIADKTLTDCLRYIRSLEYALNKQDVKLNLTHEATRRLGQLSNITPDNIADHYRSWETLKNGTIDRDASIPEQIDDDEETLIQATNNRIWERITTLNRLKNTGKGLNNCLADGHYDNEFIRGECAFWRLNDVNNVALAAMRIDIPEYTAVEFKKHSNYLAREFSKDADILLEEQGYYVESSEESDFLAIGITPTGLIGTGQADFSYQQNFITTRIWSRGQSICLQRGDDEKLTLHLEKERSLEDILYSQEIDDNYYEWLCRSIARYVNKLAVNIELNDVITTDNGWQYWRDAIIDQATFNEITFYKTDKGIAIVDDEAFSPTWIIGKHNSRAGQGGTPVYVYRLSGLKVDVIKQIECDPTIAIPFWSWVNPENNMGPSYSSLVEATKNPYCSNLQPQGWFSAEDGESWALFNSNIPNLPDSITIKSRRVFDEEGCDPINVHETHQERNYAQQLAVFVNGEPEISCLIVAEKNRVGKLKKFFRMLTSDFKSPSAVAALLSALWIKMEPGKERNFLQKHIRDNPKISGLVELQNDVRAYYYLPSIEFDNQRNTVISDNWDDDGEYSQLYSVDEDGNILWIADRDGGKLENPIIYQKHTGIENAIDYIKDQGLRVTDDWQGYLKKQGYLRLDDGGINPVVSVYLNKLEADIDDNYLCATRDSDKGEYTWIISNVYEDEDELWRLHPSSNSNYLRLESCTLNEKISPSVKSLVHAILDGCGKTMSPAQLGILNLMPLSNGGHEIADAESFPLSREKIEIDENLSWMQESIDWHLMQNTNSVCRFSYSPAGTEFFSLPSIPITEDITSAIIQFSNLLQQAEQLPFIFKINSADEFTEKFPDIAIVDDY